MTKITTVGAHALGEKKAVAVVIASDDIITDNRMCDFCSEALRGSRNLHLTTPGEIIADEPAITDQGMRTLAVDADGKWYACDRCHKLIEAGDRAGLLERALTSPVHTLQQRQWDMRALLENRGHFNGDHYLVQVQATFWKNRIVRKE